MPSTRRRRTQPHRAPLSAALREFFRTGDYDAAVRAAREAGESDGRGFKGLTEFLLAGGDHEKRWAEYGEDLVLEWIIAHAGSRPWGWWRWTASEPRRCLEGAEWLLPVVNPGDWAWAWRENMGIPGFQEERPAALVESQASYLRRLHLLTAAERKALTQEDFEPEGVAAPDDEGAEFTDEEEDDP